jgi:hypothetical protein
VVPDLMTHFRKTRSDVYGQCNGPLNNALGAVSHGIEMLGIHVSEVLESILKYSVCDDSLCGRYVA